MKIGTASVPSLDAVVADQAGLERLPTSALLALRRQVREVDAACDALLLQRVLDAAGGPVRPELGSTRAAATQLGISASTLHDKRAAGVFPYATFAEPLGTRNYRWRLDRIRAWLEDAAAYEAKYRDPAAPRSPAPRKRLARVGPLPQPSAGPVRRRD
jgi:predicted DNA-binding transcriptional regulator AlpA